MAQLRREYDLFRKKSCEILAIGPDSAEAFRRFWKENSIPFVGIPDPGHRILKTFGQEFKLFKLGRMPAQILVDTGGMVTYVHYGNAMSDIPTAGELLEQIT